MVNDVLEFNQKAKEELKYYVYALYADDAEKPFYIGKGINDRVFAHVNNTLVLAEDESEDDLKENIIRNCGSVKHKILRHGLTESQAYEIEATLIDILSLDTLANKVRGKGSYRGLMTVNEINVLYDAPEVYPIDEKAILININKQYQKVKNDPVKLLEATRGNWVLGERRAKAKYAFTISFGLIREIILIEPNSWKMEDEVFLMNKNKKKYTKRRWSFHGSICIDPIFRQKYIDHSVRQYWKTGGQNPIRYTYK